MQLHVISRKHIEFVAIKHFFVRIKAINIMYSWFSKLLLISLAVLYLARLNAFAQDTDFIYVHFLYGSKPAKGYKDVERKWFGGVLGGHVGIEIDDNRILNFMKSGKIHWISNNKNKRSRYTVHETEAFWGIFRYPTSQVKRTTIAIPITIDQKMQLDSIAENYLKQTPYDYAFFGMRCGAATYEILGKLGILPAYSIRKTCLKIFYPKKLRMRLLRKAADNQWSVTTRQGSSTRKWERD